MHICTNIGKWYVTVSPSCNLSLQSVRNVVYQICSWQEVHADFIPKTNHSSHCFLIIAKKWISGICNFS